MVKFTTYSGHIASDMFSNIAVPFFNSLVAAGACLLLTQDVCHCECDAFSPASASQKASLCTIVQVRQRIKTLPLEGGIYLTRDDWTGWNGQISCLFSTLLSFRKMHNRE